MTTTPANCASKTQMAKMHRWKSSALAAAALALTGLYATEASALALGRISVKSSLGEPLRAEIELPQISAAEAESLRVQTAAPEIFRAHGMEYSATVTGVQVDLQRRSDGSMVLRLSSTRPVNEPFVDLVLDASWSAGQIMRSYTMLLDPPALRKAPPTVTAAAQTSGGARNDDSAQRLARGSSARAQPVVPRPDMAATSVGELPAPEPDAPAPTPRAQPTSRTAKGGARTTPKPAPAAIAPAATATTAENVTVRPGDTATRLALSHRPSGVSLDQMLVAMQRSNPAAFVGGNINRLKSGAVVSIPDAEQAQAIPEAQARQIVAAQSRDFGEFRRKLAATVPTAAVAASGRSASGKVQAKVEDKRPSTAAPDKLTLTKGALKGQKAVEDDKLAKEKQASESAARLKEISRNIAELKKLKTDAPAPAPALVASAPSSAVPGVSVPIKAAPVAAPTVSTAASATKPAASSASASSTSPAASAASAASTAALAPASTPAPVLAGASQPSVAASTPALPASSGASSATSSATPSMAASVAGPSVVASEPLGGASVSTPASAPAPAPKPAPLPVPPAPAPTPEPEPEPSFLDTLTEDPMLPLAGGGLLALLLGYVGYRKWQQRRTNTTGVDSTFIESKMPPDSFFGQSGGQHVDTANTDMSTGSSLAYSPSQLDTGGDVDPVAEADVYLAYGRDLQAEEILKEAARHNPTRVSIHVKLAEIYAKRQDRKALESAAAAVFEQTDGQGPDWARVAELGRLIDPDNALYQPGGVPGAPAHTDNTFSASDFLGHDSAPAPLTDFPSTTPGSPSLSALDRHTPVAQPPDFDLDLDLALPDTNAPLAKAAPGPFAAAAAAAAAPSLPTLPELNLDLGTEPVLEPLPMLEPLPDLGMALEPTLDLPDFSTPKATKSAAPAPAPAPVAASKAPSLSMDLDFPTGDLELAHSAQAPLTPLSGAGSSASSMSGTPAPAKAAPAPVVEPEASLEFDLGDLNFDLDNRTPAKPAAKASSPVAAPAPAQEPEFDESDPLATKLALAEEFHGIGDTDGARSMIEEVIAEASGPLKERAQRLLANLT